ncbi:aldehyde ferredoxin oxidoreductase family protein [Syntrophomonas erecta]
MFGWMGTVLRVDLTAGKVTREKLDESLARDYIGGRGFNSRVLYDEIKPGIDPLGQENVICFAPGPFTGSGLTSSSRVEVSTLSPYSYILGDGNAGGNFATYLKRAGYDQIIVTGKASSPVYLWIDNEEIQLCEAGPIWGLNTWEATDYLQERYGSDISVAAIGQAGENLVRYASTIFDKYNSAARGSGAVMGSKNLKAIVVRGNQKVAVARPEEFKDLAREDRDFFLNDDFQREVAAVYGSHIGMGRWFPGLRYFEKYLSEEEIPHKLTPEAMKEFEVKRTACYGCVVPCKDVFRIPEGEYAGEIGKALEHECIFCLGTNCGITEPVPILVMENLADKYGMCVVALGNAVAFAKFLYNQGIITDQDTGGLSLEWEDATSQIQLLHQVAFRQGFGNIVAEGMYSMAKILGRGAMDYCYHVKGDSRGPHPAGIFGLAHATSTRGADHLRGRSWAFGENDPKIWPQLVEKGYIPVDDPVATLAVSERATTLTDMIGRCKGAVNNWASAVPLVHKYPLFEGVARLLTAATGQEFNEETVAQAADRVYLLEMAFNARQGISRKHDRLPLKPEIINSETGQEELRKHDEMLNAYYSIRGCNPDTGIPSGEQLQKLGLDFAARELSEPEFQKEWDGPPLWPLENYPRGEKRA